MRRILLTTAVAMMFVWGAQAQFVPSKGNGPGNSAGYQGNGPRDGSGYGAKAGKSKRQGGGICDQTGPKGPRGAQSGAQRGGRGRR